MSSEIHERVVLLASRENLPESRVVVPGQLEGPDPLVEATLASLQAAKPDERGFVKPKRRGCLDLQVSPAGIDRACRILNSLIGAFRDRNLAFGIRRCQESNVMVVTVLDEEIQFDMVELTERRERPPTEQEKWWLRWSKDKKFYHRVPCGRLCLRVMTSPAPTRKSNFSDTPTRRLEDNLHRFLANLYRVAEDIKIDRVERAEAEIRAAEARARAAEEQVRAKEAERQRLIRLQEVLEEEQRVVSLMQEVDAWFRSETMRRFIEVKSRLLPESERQAWVEWAMVHADRMDPLKESPHSIIDEKAELQICRYRDPERLSGTIWSDR